MNPELNRKNLQDISTATIWFIGSLINMFATQLAGEKEIKGWRREKKVALIESMNPEWQVLNSEIQG